MLGKLIDNRKKLLYVLAVLVGAIALLGTVMMVMSKVNDGQALAESEAATEAAASGDAIVVEDVSIDASDAHAAELFSCKVEDMHDSAAVATLLTVMRLENATGKYAVQIAEKDGAQTLTLTMELPMMKNDEEAFNVNMEKYAQQMLALIPQIDKVEWIYSVKASESETQAVGSMDDAAATEALGKAPDSFGKNQRAFGRLLALQTAL